MFLEQEIKNFWLKMTYKWRLLPFSSGPKTKELKDTASCVILILEEPLKNMILSWTFNTLMKGKVSRTLLLMNLMEIFWSEMKLMEVVFLQEVWDKLTSPEPTLFGITSLISIFEEKIKLFTFLLSSLLIMEKVLEKRLSLEWQKKFFKNKQIIFWINSESNI